MKFPSKYQRRNKLRMPEREEGGNHCYHLEVDIADIQPDGKYQRKNSESKLKKFLIDFVRRAVGTPILNLRTDGTFWVIDGQHRLLKLLPHFGITKWRCEVHVGLTLAEEADLFERTNDGKPVSFNDRFRSGLVANRLEPKTILRVVESHGFVLYLGGKKRPDHITSASALTHIFKLKIGRKSILDDFLTIYKRLFTTMNNGTLEVKEAAQDAQFVQGLGLAIFRLMVDGLTIKQIASALFGVSAKRVLNTVKTQGYGKIEGTAQEFERRVVASLERPTRRKAA